MRVRTLCCALVLLAQPVLAQEEAARPAAGPIPALPAPKAAQDRLLDIVVAGPRAVAAGQEGVILFSDDGRKWQQADVPVSAMLTRLRFTDERNGWATGYDAALLHTTDGGEHWSVRHYDTSARALYDVLFLDAQHGIAVGAYGNHLESRDGGKTWAVQDSALSKLGMHMNVLLRMPDGALFVAGERGLAARSTDAGVTWQILDTPYGGSWFGALPLGENSILLYGMRGNVFIADDVAACATIDAALWDPYAREMMTDSARIAALGWRKLESPTKESLFGAMPLDPQTVMLVGVNGTALSLDVTAGTLSALTAPAKETLSKLASFRGRILAVGRKGIQDLGAMQ